jgi:hypothetical protein
MCDQHEKEIVKEADAFERGQSSPSPDNEEGSRDQKLPISQVGQTNDRKREGASAQGCVSARSRWFDDKTCEIGAGETQFEFGWVYRRTKTGHLRIITHGRDSVSELHSSEARPL